MPFVIRATGPGLGLQGIQDPVPGTARALQRMHVAFLSSLPRRIPTGTGVTVLAAVSTIRRIRRPLILDYGDPAERVGDSQLVRSR